MLIKRIIHRFADPMISRYSRCLEQVQHGRVLTKEEGNSLIYNNIVNGVPSAIGKFGSVELCAFSHHISGSVEKHTPSWQACANELYTNAGVFPHSESAFSDFFDEFRQSIDQMSILGVWYNRGEAHVANIYCKKCVRSHHHCLEPYYHSDPWSRALAGKTVLVLHPFVTTIEAQYKKRVEIWAGSPDVLPQFNLVTIRVPLSDALVKSPYDSWLSCLDDMKQKMCSLDFDVAIIGAGAYSLPLAAHAKRLGRIGIHMGGATQILFGIIGNRWQGHPVISGFFNEHWCKPSPEESPEHRTLIERGCYW